MRFLPAALLLVSAVFHYFSLRQPFDTFWFTLFGGLSLLAIYFGDHIGETTGIWTRGGYIDEPTPGVFIKIFGWIALLLICFVLLNGVPIKGRFS